MIPAYILLVLEDVQDSDEKVCQINSKCTKEIAEFKRIFEKKLEYINLLREPYV